MYVVLCAFQIKLQMYNMSNSEVAQSVKNLRAVQEPWVQSLGQGRPSGEGNGYR